MNKLSKRGAAFVRLHEGFVAKWYLDPAGIPTIGIGFTWRSDSFQRWWKRNKKNQPFRRGATMTRGEADACLQYLVKSEYGKAVNKFLAKKVAQNVFDGMISPVYNMGYGSLRWKWAAAIKRGAINEGARLLRRTGTTSCGKKYPGLVRRRAEESLVLTDGVYTGVDNVHRLEVKPNPMADGVLERREAGEAVAKLIKDLHKLGHYDGVMDDVFGYGTQMAVLDFQREHSLTADGKAGSQTLGEIKLALAA